MTLQQRNNSNVYKLPEKKVIKKLFGYVIKQGYPATTSTISSKWQGKEKLLHKIPNIINEGFVCHFSKVF